MIVVTSEPVSLVVPGGAAPTVGPCVKNAAEPPLDNLIQVIKMDTMLDSKELADSATIHQYLSDEPNRGAPEVKTGMFYGSVTQFPLPNQIGFVGSVFAYGESESQVRLQLALKISQQLRP